MFVEEKTQGEVGLDEASKILLKAASLIEERGWCQHALETHEGRMCANGAVWIAAGRPVSKDGVPPPEWHLTYRAARTRLWSSVGHVHDWNDAKDRTQAEVVAKLRAVALGL